MSGEFVKYGNGMVPLCPECGTLMKLQCLSDDG